MSPSAQDLEIVRRAGAFGALSERTFRTLIGPAQTRQLDSGETVFRQGEPATAFYIVVEGWVKVHRYSSTGEEAVIHVFAREVAGRPT